MSTCVFSQSRAGLAECLAGKKWHGCLHSYSKWRIAMGTEYLCTFPGFAEILFIGLILAFLKGVWIGLTQE